MPIGYISMCVYNQAIGSIFYSFFFPNLLFSFWNSLFGTKWNRMANFKHASNFMQRKQQTGIYVYLKYTPFQETKCLLFKIKKKMNEKNRILIKKANRVHSRCVFLPKMVLRCRNRDAVSFLLSWIFDVNFLTSTCVFFINMMLTMAMLYVGNLCCGFLTHRHWF